MAERYTRIFTLPPQYVAAAPNCPVSVDAGAMLFDGALNKMLGQLKFRNNSPKSIRGVSITLKAFDAQGAKIAEDINFEYTNVAAEPGEFFGTQTPVYMNDNNARVFQVEIENVQFSDGTAWSKTNEQFKEAAKNIGTQSVQMAKNAVETTKKRVLPFLVNLLVFFVFAICSISFLVVLSGEHDSEDVKLGIGFLLMTIISFPGIGSMLAKRENGKLLRIIRWVIVLVIFLITWFVV